MKYDWNDQEVKALFSLVEDFKKQNKTLLEAFSVHAQKFDRKPLSVRNFYYQKCDEILENQDLQRKLDINIKLHQKNNFAKFDERQTDKLLAFIKKRQQEGKSVRSACMELSNNDAKMLVRLQNKYRAEKQKQVEKQSSKNSLRTENIATKNSSNIISFPVEQKLVPQKLTDAEIQSLFLGLVNLIKKSTKQTMIEDIEKEREKLSVVVRNTTLEMQQKNEKIDMLLAENQKLTKQVLCLKTKLEQMRSSFLEKIKI